jgi:hypothetical protein
MTHSEKFPAPATSRFERTLSPGLAHKFGVTRARSLGQLTGVRCLAHKAFKMSNFQRR